VMDGPWQHEERIVLARNDNWKGGIYDDGELARVDKIEFRISRDIDSAYADFEAGNGHTAAIPSGRFAEATGAYSNATENTLGVYHFFVNQENEQVGGEENLKLRQAISLAIDRDAVNDAAFDGSRRVADGMTPPGIPGYEEGLCEYCDYDPERAQELFDEWEAEGGSLTGPIAMQFNSGSGHEDVVAIIQANLKDNLGIDVTLDGRDPTNYFAEMRSGECVICRAGWIWDYPTYDNAAYSLLHSSTIDGDNIGRYSNPEVDSLLIEARGITDDDERYETYVEAERLAMEDLPLIPVVWYAGNIVHADDVENFVQTPGQFVLYERVTLSS
jgi:oligopeptide transport system substrate-binding protein